MWRNALASLPDANEVRLVLRKVDGCDYQEITRFNVSTGGPALAHSVLVPAGRGAIEPAQPAAQGR